MTIAIFCGCCSIWLNTAPNSQWSLYEVFMSGCRLSSNVEKHLIMQAFRYCTAKNVKICHISRKAFPLWKRHLLLVEALFNFGQSFVHKTFLKVAVIFVIIFALKVREQW